MGALYTDKTFAGMGDADVLRIANDIAYGLGAGVWTQSIRRATMMASKIKAGTV